MASFRRGTIHRARRTCLATCPPSALLSRARMSGFRCFESAHSSETRSRSNPRPKSGVVSSAHVLVSTVENMERKGCATNRNGEVIAPMHPHLHPAALFMVSGAFSIWLTCLGFRRKYGLDHKLDRTGRLIRWFVVFASAILVVFELVPPGNVAVAIGLLSLGFFAWPNFAFYLTQLLRRAWIMRKPRDYVRGA